MHASNLQKKTMFFVEAGKLLPSDPTLFDRSLGSSEFLPLLKSRWRTTRRLTWRRCGCVDPETPVIEANSRIPSGKLTVGYEKSQFFMGKSKNKLPIALSV